MFPLVGQAAPPVVVPQVTPVTVKLLTAGSVKMAPFASDGPPLLTTTVYVAAVFALTLATPSVLVIPRFATRLIVVLPLAVSGATFAPSDVLVAMVVFTATGPVPGAV